MSSPTPQGLKPPGILKEGFLTKKGQNYKTWRKRYFIVLDGHILYFKDRDDLFHPLGIIYLQESFLDRDPFYGKKDNTFVIRSQSKRFMLSAESIEEKEVWIRVLEKTINLTASRAKLIQQNGGSPPPSTSASVANLSSSVPSSSALGGSALQNGDGENVVEELQKEKESTLKLLQTLNTIDKPMGLLLSGVETINNLLSQNEYVSDSEMEKRKMQKKLMEKRKSKKILEDISDSDSDQDSSDDEPSSAKKEGEEEDLRTFTLSTYFVPNKGTSASRILTNPSDRLSQMKEDLENASESCEKVKEKYLKQIQLYKDKVRVRKNLPRWSNTLKELREQQKHIHKDFDVMQKYMETAMYDATKHLKTICVGIQRSTVVLTSPRGSGTGSTEVHGSVFDPEKDQYRVELEQMREENRRLQEEMRQAKERDEQNNKALQELQHHKKLLIKEVKNLRTGKK